MNPRRAFQVSGAGLVLALLLCSTASWSFVASDNGGAGGLSPFDQGDSNPLLPGSGTGSAPVALINESCPSDAPARTTAVAEAESLVAGHAVPSDVAYLPAKPVGSVGVADAPGSTFRNPPAPMGVADLGVGANGSYAYNTSEVLGIANITAASVDSPGDSLWSSTPDWWSVQLDAVGDNLPYYNGPQGDPYDFNRSFGDFWAQDVARMNSTTLQIVDNVWNLSSPSGEGIFPGAIVNYSGTYVDCDFYYDEGPTFSIEYPLTIELTETDGLNASGFPFFAFGYNLTDPLGSSNGTFDVVTFNGTGPPGEPSAFVVNGSAVTPFGLPEDTEFVLGGDGGGSNAMFQNFSGNLNLYHRSANNSSWVAPAAAYDFGDDSAETSEGVVPYYEGTTVFLGGGPSFLYGLWGTSPYAGFTVASPGWINGDVDAGSAQSYLFATNGSAPNFNVSSYVPLNASGDAHIVLPNLTGVPFDFQAWSNGADPSGVVQVVSNATGPVNVSVTPAPGVVDAPVYLRSFADVAALLTDGIPGVSTTGGMTNLWINDTSVRLAPPFRQLNDYGTPLYNLLEDEVGPTLTVHVDDFTQSGSADQYSQQGLPELSLPGWSQGMFFYRAGPNSSVENISTQGTVYVPASIGIRDPGTVEFSSTDDVRVSNLLMNGTGTALTLIDVSNAKVTNVTSDAFSLGIYLLDTTSVEVNHLNVNSYLNPDDDDDIDLPDLGGRNVADGPSGPNSTAAWWFAPTCDQTVFGIMVSVDRDDDGSSGLCSFGGSSLAVQNVTVIGDGGWGVLVRAMENVSVGRVNVSDFGTAGQFDLSTDLSVYDLQISNALTGGWNFTFSHHIDAWNLEAIGSNTTAFDSGNGSSNIRVWNVTAVQGGVGIYSLLNSTNVALSNFTAESGGYGAVYLGFIVNLSASNFRVAGGSGGLGAFFPTNLTVRNVSADGSSSGVLIDGGNRVDVQGVVATNGSIGVELTGVSNSTVTDSSANEHSVAVTWTNGGNDTISNVSAGVESEGVYAQGVSNSTIEGVNATEPALVESYFINPVYGVPFPVAAVATSSTADLRVENVSATSYGFGEWDLVSADLLVGGLRMWNGGTAVQSNFSANVTISGLFAFGNEMGVDLFLPTDITLEGSTIEQSVSFGLDVVGGIGTLAFGNNFVGNHGASVSGVYSPATVQASVGNLGTGALSFAGIGNYWSDWNRSGPYEVSANISDPDPQPHFISTWLSFEATGLSPGLRWGVSFSGLRYSLTQPLLLLPGWTVPSAPTVFSVEPPAGWSATPRGGSFTYLGVNTTIPLAFSEPYYNVSFQASGLPDGTVWTVELAGNLEANLSESGTGVVSFSQPNGTYSYVLTGTSGYHENSVPYSGSVTVQGGPAAIDVDFSRVTYSVEFTESGLPSGTPWNVTLAGTTLTPNGAGQISTTAPNGTFSYRISTVAGWFESTARYEGNVTVRGGNVTVSTVWSQVEYGITFAETGLASGTEWTVTLNGVVFSSTGDLVDLSLPNGSYTYSVQLVGAAGYAPTPATGSLVVNGSGSVLAVQFSATTSIAPVTPSWAWAVVGAVVAALVLGGLWMIERRRSRSEGPKPPRTPGRPPSPPPYDPDAGEARERAPHFVEEVPRVSDESGGDRAWGTPQPVQPGAYDPPQAGP